MAPEQRSKQDIWQQHLDSWRQSQLSQREYCKQNNISFSSFGYWRNRLNRSAKAGSKLVPVSLARASSSVAVFLPGGIRMEVPCHTLADVLPIVYRTVQAQPG